MVEAVTRGIRVRVAALFLPTQCWGGSEEELAYWPYIFRCACAEGAACLHKVITCCLLN